jgi:hypothetical protein
MTRFELKLPEARRAALESLADEVGVSSADLVRLAISQMLEGRAITLPAAARGNQEAA